MLYPPPRSPSLASNASRRGFGSRRTRCTCDYFLLIQFTDLNRTYMTKRETSLFVVYLHPLPRSKRETEGVVSLSTYHHHHHPLPRSNCKTEGSFFCQQTPPTLELRDRGFLCQQTPPSLETRDRGVFFTPSTPSLARNVRRRGYFFCQCKIFLLVNLLEV